MLLEMKLALELEVELEVEVELDLELELELDLDLELHPPPARPPPTHSPLWYCFPLTCCNCPPYLSAYLSPIFGASAPGSSQGCINGHIVVDI